MQHISGKYMALVVENDYEANVDCPCPGSVKVICPQLFLFQPSILNDIVQLFTKNCAVSEWIRPHYTHPGDFYIPKKGEGVYIECLAGFGTDKMIWTGVYPGEDFDNIDTMMKESGINKNITAQTDRMIGDREGNYIKFEGVEGTGKLIIEVAGKSMTNLVRIGHKITLDPVAGLEYADKGGTAKIVFGPNGMTVTDIKGNKITLSDSGIVLEDKNANKVTMDSSGMIIKDKNNNEIDLTATGCTLKDKNSNEVQMAAAGVKLKTGDATAWMPNILPACLFTGAPHGGSGAGVVKLTGG